MLRRTLQIFCLAVFFGLLMAAALGAEPAGLSLFLQLDPGLSLLTALAGRSWTWSLAPAGAVLVSVLVFGRAFCGYVCPLGTTLDGTDHVLGHKKTATRPTGPWASVKFLILAFLLGAAVFGVSWLFFFLPLSLITRLYGLVLYPAGVFLAGGILDQVRPLAETWDMGSLVFAQIHPVRFASQFLVVLFFLLVFGLGRIAPRFWCRNLCPSGALMGLLSVKPLIRRTVSEECIQCGRCTRACPMSAIPEEDPLRTRFSECISCRTCARVCPVNAIAFSLTGPASRPSETLRPDRRRFLAAGLAGAGTAIMGLTGLDSLVGKPGEGQMPLPGLVRPPGALPEMDFLAACVRCGECMVACPTNTLQPLVFKTGILSLFSPGLTPRRGFCDPRCHRCGEVCPTGAIRLLEPSDRIFAKTGTAVINRRKCLAWEHQKSCMVCDEVCPFDAIDFKMTPESPVTVPFVVEDRCAGCGYCEHYCPVRNLPAIVVTPMGEIRLAKGHYQEEAGARGLKLSLKPKGPYPADQAEPQPEGLAPGFSE